MSAAQLQRRFVLLTGLRWLPVGFIVPVTVLLATARGLTPVDIGLVFTAHSVVVVLLELPTGGLGDSLGRRPVLLLSGTVNLAGLLLVVVASSPLAFAAAYAVIGTARALDSGPLESWYVDALHELDPTADPTTGLSRAGVASGAALTLGAVVGGLLPLLSDSSLALPYVVAAGLTVAQLACVAVLVVPVGPARPPRSAGAALAHGVRDVPRVVREATALARRDRSLRLLLVLTVCTGAALTTIELLAPLRFAAVTGGVARGGGAYGVVVALGFAGAAVGAGLAPTGRRLLRGSAPRTIAVAATGGAAVMVGLGLADSVALLGVGFAAFYLLNGISGPLRQRLLHERVGAAHRTTMVSVLSLALQLGGVIDNQIAPRLYALAPVLAFGAAGAVLLVLALVALRLPSDAGVERLTRKDIPV